MGFITIEYHLGVFFVQPPSASPRRMDEMILPLELLGEQWKKTGWLRYIVDYTNYPIKYRDYDTAL